MEDLYITERIFDKEDFTRKPLANGEYEHCSFMNCDFSNTDLKGMSFTACTFSGCNISMAKLTQTAFRTVLFTGCKMLGLHFEQCNPFGLSFRFEHCILNHSSFYQVKMTKTIFRSVQLHEVDFTDADITGAVLDNCDLSGATFDHTILEKADLRTAYHYAIHPETNKIKKAKFSMPGLTGLLDRYGIIID